MADEPRLPASAIASVIDAWDGRRPAVRATFLVVPGHPVILARELYPAIAELRGDTGARDLLRRVAIETVDCGTPVGDIDTRSDLEAQRAAKATQPDEPA